jgi:hypothetical protein
LDHLGSNPGYTSPARLFRTRRYGVARHHVHLVSYLDPLGEKPADNNVLAGIHLGLLLHQKILKKGIPIEPQLRLAGFFVTLRSYPWSCQNRTYIVTLDDLIEGSPELHLVHVKYDRDQSSLILVHGCPPFFLGAFSNARGSHPYKNTDTFF